MSMRGGSMVVVDSGSDAIGGCCCAGTAAMRTYCHAAHPVAAPTIARPSQPPPCGAPPAATLRRNNRNGELGRGPTVPEPAREAGGEPLNVTRVPREVAGNLAFKSLTAGYWHVCGQLLDNDTWMCWGACSCRACAVAAVLQASRDLGSMSQT